jgi:hypothetical protein
MSNGIISISSSDGDDSTIVGVDDTTGEFKQPLKIFVVAYFVLRVSCVSKVQTGSVQIQIQSEGLTLSSRPPLIWICTCVLFLFSLKNFERIVKKLPFRRKVQ